MEKSDHQTAFGEDSVTALLTAQNADRARRAMLTQQNSDPPHVVTVATEPSMSSESQQSSGEKSAAKESRCRRCLRSSVPYIRDTVLILTVLAVTGITRQLGPASPGFFCNDPSITYPFKGDSVSVPVLFAATVLLPVLVIGAVEVLHQRRGWAWSWRRPVWVTCVLTLRQLVCQACLFAVTEVIKALAAQPRPCFLALCRPTAYNKTLCDTGSFISSFECGGLAGASKEQRILIMDSMLSFPSGHAATATCTATFLAIYLLRRWGGRGRSVLRLWLCLVCSLYAVGISFSRIADHRHHLLDVLAGMALGGLAAAALSYCVCANKLLGGPSQPPLLATQSSVISSRTTDTQATSHASVELGL